MGAETMAAGLALQVYGQYEQSRAQRNAARANAQYLREQAELQRIATEREADIFAKESAAFIGDQISIIGQSGVDLSGSLLMQLAGEKQSIEAERQAILLSGKKAVALTQLRARQAEKEARDAMTVGLISSVGAITATAGAYMNSSNKLNSSSVSSSSRGVGGSGPGYSGGGTLNHSRPMGHSARAKF
jgi:hypothetical protein